VAPQASVSMQEFNFLIIFLRNVLLYNVYCSQFTISF